MTTREEINGQIKVGIQSHMPDSRYIPKQVQIRRSDLSLLASKWVTRENAEFPAPTGIYLVQVHLSSGNKIEKIVEVKANKPTEVKFDIGLYSPRETQEWMYLTKHASGTNPVLKTIKGNFFNKVLHNISGTLWTYDGINWQHYPSPDIYNVSIDEIGESFTIQTLPRLQVLQIEIPGHPPCFVCLPPAQNVRCLIRLASEHSKNTSIIDVSVSTPNEKAEALLSLMASGDMNRAKEMMPLLDDAEGLLYAKFSDTASAVIGGYFLLKSGALDKMHHWAENLAYKFKWLPDGMIIHAWELIQKGVPDLYNKTRALFLEAVARGIPVYTEGLRLLYEGLAMLSFESGKKDPEIERSLSWVRAYLNEADVSQETTTFIRIFPGLPGKKIQFVKKTPGGGHGNMDSIEDLEKLMEEMSRNNLNTGYNNNKLTQ